MQVFKSTLLQYRRNSIIAIIFALAFGMVFLGFYMDFKKQKVQNLDDISLVIALDDQAQSTYSQAVKEFLSQHKLIFKKLPEGRRIMEVMTGAYHAVMEIPKDFDEKIQRKEKDPLLMEIQESFSAAYLREEMNLFLTALQEYGPENALQMMEVPLATTVISKVKDQQEVGKALSRSFAFVYMMIFFFVIGSNSIIQKEIKMKRRCHISSTTILHQKLQTYLAQILYGIFFTIPFLLFIFLLGKFPMVYMFHYTLSHFVYMLSLVGLTDLMVQVIPNQKALTPVANLLAFIISMTSGAAVPARFLSENVLRFAQLFPEYHHVMNVDVYGTGAYWLHIAIMLLMGILYFFIALYLDKRNSQSS